MRSWIKEVLPCQIEDGKLYFIATRHNSPGSYSFYSRGLNGKKSWSVKPGIAIRFTGGAPLVAELAKNQNLVALEVPVDADKRWKARKRRFSWQKS